MERLVCAALLTALIGCSEREIHAADDGDAADEADGGSDIEALCGDHCDRMFGECAPPTQLLYATEDECVRGCSAQQGEGCDAEEAALLDCLLDLPCDEYARSFDDPWGSACEDQVVEEQTCGP